MAGGAVVVGSRGAGGAAGLGLALAAAALAFDVVALWVAAVTLLALAFSAVLWVRVAAQGTAIRRTLGVRRVEEGNEFAVTIEVRTARPPFPGGVVRDGLVRRPVELRAGGRGVRIEARARFERRGLHRLAATEVVVRDPFGLSARRAPGGSDDELLVLPRVEAVLAGEGEGGDESGPPSRGRVTGCAATDIDGVGPLRDGTPASRVYWPSVARGVQSLERRFRADGDGRPLIVLDSRAPAQPEDLDAAVRATASLAVHLARQGGCWLALPGARRPVALEPNLAGWSAVHAQLALVEDRGAPARVDVTGRRGPIVLVSARRRERPPPGLGVGVAVRTLVVPGVLRGRSPSFAVAGCHGYAVERGARRAAVGGAA